MSKLWQTRKLSELAEVKIGPFGSALKIGELKTSGPARVLYIENIVGDRFNNDKEKFITAEKYESLRQYTVKPDDIVVTIMGTIGRTALVPHGLGDTIISSHLIKISADRDKVIPAFLNYVLQSGYVFGQMMHHSKGAIMKGLNSTILKNLDIPLPGISEQKKIIDRLDTIQKLRSANADLIDKTQELFNSVLHEEFNNKTNFKTLGEVCSKITDGSHYTPKLQTSGFPFITISNVLNGTIDLSTVQKFIKDEDYHALVANDCKPLKGDVLFSKDGTVGKVVAIKEERDFVVLSSLAILRPSEKVLQDYLSYFLSSSNALEQATNKKTGAVIRRIVLKDLKQVKIPLPSIDEQKRIIAKLNAVRSYEKTLSKQKNLNEELFSAVLSKLQLVNT